MIFAEQSSCLPQPATPAFAEGPKRLRACAVILAQEWRTVSAVLAWRQRVIKEQKL